METQNVEISTAEVSLSSDKKDKTYSYDEAYQQSLEYFNGNELAAKVFVDKYAIRDNEGNYRELTPDSMHDRLAAAFASVDAKYGQDYTERFNIYREAMRNFARIVPQGSPMAAVGNDYQLMSASNCVVVESPEDSLSGIIRSGLELAQLYKRRCGVGIDISTLRPDGMHVNNAARTTSGAWSFADFFSYITRMIGQDSRRGALMITMDVHHPDVVKFSTMKQDLKKVTGANVSVRLSDEFMKAVDEDTEYELRWPCEGVPKVRKRVRARDVWSVIIDSATTTAEPGLIIWGNMLSNLPAHCYDQFKTISTNPSLRGDTLVLTSCGAVPIRSLAGQTIMVKNINGQWKEAKCFLSGKDQQLVKLTFTNGQTVFCTKEHKWPVLNTLGRVYDKRTGEPNKRASVDLKRGNKIPFPFVKDAIDNKDCTFSRKDGFVLGWLYGDGWISYHKVNESEQLGFIFNDKEGEIGDSVLAYTNALAKTASTLRRDHDSKALTFCTTDNRVLDKVISTLGAKRKQFGLPETLFRGSAEFVSGFIDGIFSADAYVRVTDNLSTCQIVLVSAHEKLVTDLQKLLSFYGIRSNIRKSIATSSFPKVKSDKLYTRYDLNISGIFAQKFANCFVLTSHEKSEKLVTIRDKSTQSADAVKTSYANEREYLVIKDIELTDIHEDVFDITVFDDTHTFMTEVGITGNCSEIALSAYDSCRLISINLTGYVKNPFQPTAVFDYGLFIKDVELAMQMADNLVDIELGLIDRIKASCEDDIDEEADRLLKNMVVERVPDEIVERTEKALSARSEKALWERLRRSGQEGRRTGLGTHGLADALAQLRIRYDSREAIDTVENIYATMRNTAYRTSAELAKTRGSFPAFDWEKEKDNEFIERLPKDVKMSMKKHGRRNIALLTQAPTGSVSIISKVGEFNTYNVSSGVEPVFRNTYIRRKKINAGDHETRVDFVDDLGDNWQEFHVYHSNTQNFLTSVGIKVNAEDFEDVVELPGYFVTSDQIDWENRISLQGAEQQYIDHSISSTINLPKGTSPGVVGELYLAAWKRGLKGVTVYVDGSRSGVLVTGDEEEQKNDGFHERSAIRRPGTLDSETHKIKVDFGDAKPVNGYVVISFFPGTRRPYELFVVAPNQGLDDKDQQILELTARNTSMSLRHGVPLRYICEQLEKVGGQYIYSIPANIAKLLRSYDTDVDIEEPAYEPAKKTSNGNGNGSNGHSSRYLTKCPECKQRTYIVQGICGTCINCAHSGCS